MRRDTLTGFVLGASVTAAAGVLWYRNWASIPEVRVALRSGEEIPLRLRPPYPAPTLPEHDHWTYASEEEVEVAFAAMEERRVNAARLRPVDRQQWCGDEAEHPAHQLCGGVVPSLDDGRPQCEWPEIHDAHVWRDVENEGHQNARPRYCRGRAVEGE